MFGLTIPGREVVTQFQQVGPAKYLIELPSADLIHEVAFFLLPGSQLPQDHLACLYSSLPPFSDWNLVSVVSAVYPSNISLVRFHSSVGAGMPVQFGIAVEPSTPQMVQHLASVHTGRFTMDDTKEFARAIATDLFRFLDSFGHSYGSNELKMMDKWYEKFSTKIEKDPDFWKQVKNHD